MWNQTDATIWTYELILLTSTSVLIDFPRICPTVGCFWDRLQFFASEKSRSFFEIEYEGFSGGVNVYDKHIYLLQGKQREKFIRGPLLFRYYIN